MGAVGNIPSSAQLFAKRAELDARRPLDAETLDALRDSFLASYVFNSNAIEGIHAPFSETQLALAGVMLEPKYRDEYAAIKGQKEGYEYICSLVSEGLPLDAEAVRMLNYYVNYADRVERGTYRSAPAYIGGVKRSLDPDLVPAMMELLVSAWAERAGDLFGDVARFHIIFENVHPFADGNGRCGRLLMNLQLMQEGFPPIEIKYADMQGYLQTLDRLGDETAVEELAGMIREAVGFQLARYLAAANGGEFAQPVPEGNPIPADLPQPHTVANLEQSLKAAIAALCG